MGLMARGEKIFASLLVLVLLSPSAPHAGTAAQSKLSRNQRGKDHLACATLRARSFEPKRGEGDGDCDKLVDGEMKPEAMKTALTERKINLRDRLAERMRGCEALVRLRGGYRSYGTFDDDADGGAVNDFIEQSAAQAHFNLDNWGDKEEVEKILRQQEMCKIFHQRTGLNQGVSRVLLMTHEWDIE